MASSIASRRSLFFDPVTLCQNPLIFCRRKRDQRNCQLIQIQDLIPDRTDERKLQTYGLILKFRPEDSRRIQKFCRLVQPDPLFSLGNTGLVSRLCAGLSCIAELIKVDFPTFGIPTTIARTGRFLMPLFQVPLYLFPAGFLDNAVNGLHSRAGSWHSASST